ncbi:hypothetical protein [Actinomadura bangladeshensis]|uniref:Uncharacterized protein n=1 Tax=Actinomadura bangladeshensis TaxID=453573 RepID=A0A6L9QAR2_9ACTN|nr:hypothetical protein [Actinomadura bangladeshensis]NEA21610.1 hypothetical protein [Actinomadura bangladeshensis]NEA22570.1 hypothetical protein [Actinomadura bangladeshensis]
MLDELEDLDVGWPYSVAQIATLPHDRQAQELRGATLNAVAIDPPVPRGLWQMCAKELTEELIAQARKELVHGPWPENAPLPPTADSVSRTTYLCLCDYRADADGPRDQLYALEFQGPRTQYIKFGHSKRLCRRIKLHRDVAKAHGFALLNGWASPGVADARLMEQSLLRYARSFEHQHVVAAERFYGMCFGIARDLTRAVFTEETRPDS